MAIEEFWVNLRTAASLYTPKVAVDSATGDTNSVARMLRDALMWLTTRSVDGFDATDFPFLGEEQQAALAASVERFRAVASQVPGNKPASRQQEEEGRNAFGDILKILQPHRFVDAESFAASVTLKREVLDDLPDWVTGLSCETGTDVGGDPGIWIWLDVTDDAVDKRKIAKQGQQIEEKVEAAYRRIGGRRWPFIRFRSPDAFPRRQGASA